MTLRTLFLCLITFASLKADAYRLTACIPQQNPTKTAVIVCPGGSYFWLDRNNEGKHVAEWLCSNHIAAFVLEYSHAGWAAFTFHMRASHRSFPAGYNDLCSALDSVRNNAASMGICPDRIGCMGFSAGGHLVMHAAEQLASTGKSVAFVVPIYPVVTMTSPCVHKRSRRGLMGEFPKREMMDSLSLEHHVPDNCPPVFLVNCKDDPIVDYQNAELLDSALLSHNIPHQYEQYATGGHGFGVSKEKTTTEAIQWMQSFLNWFRQLFPETE